MTLEMRRWLTEIWRYAISTAMENGKTWLISANPDYPPMGVTGLGGRLSLTFLCHDNFIFNYLDLFRCQRQSPLEPASATFPG
jgi:hypothetical protein